MASQVTVAKYLNEGRDTVSRERSLEVATLMDGRRDYVPLASNWKCG